MVFLVLSFILLFWYSVKNFDLYQIPIASEHGVDTDRLFWITMGVTGVVFIITQILLFYFSFKYQYSSKRRLCFFQIITSWK
jgi:cytochrome c oxidase subunit 2